MRWARPGVQMGIGSFKTASFGTAYGGQLVCIPLSRCALLAGIAVGIVGCTEAQMNASTPMQGSPPSAAAASGSPRPLTSRGLQEPEVANPTPALPSSRAEIISGNGTL